MAYATNYPDPFDPGRRHIRPGYYDAPRRRRDRSADSATSRAGSTQLRPSYRQLDAGAVMRARLQRAPEEPATVPISRRFHADNPWFEDENERREVHNLRPQRSKIAAPPLLEHYRGSYQPIFEAKEPVLEEEFDLELTFLREDTWAPSIIDSEVSLTLGPASLEPESTEGQPTSLNVFTSWAWGHEPNSLNGGELHGYTGPSNPRQPCHFRWS